MTNFHKVLNYRQWGGGGGKVGGLEGIIRISQSPIGGSV